MPLMPLNLKSISQPTKKISKFLNKQRGVRNLQESLEREVDLGGENTEEVGFEPTVGCPTSVFKTDALGHSATLP